LEIHLVADIAQAYHEGFGNTSCMTGGSISSIKQLLSLYVENPEKIQLAKYYYGSSQARALIWHVAEGEIFIDRIYSNIVNIREDFISEIKNLYKDKTVHLREHNNLPCGEETFKSFCFDLNEPSSGEYPFLDTFRYANESTAINTITVSNNSDGMDYLCNNCDGTTGEILFCDDCGEIIIGDSRYIEIYDKTVCEGCFDNCYETCDDCGVYEKADNILSALGNRNVCENCLKDNYTFCECCETNHWKSDVQYIQSTESNVCNTCLTENYSKCNDCGKYHLITDLHKAFNNNMEVHLCSICLDNKYERCSVCGDYFRKKKLFEFFGSSYCEKCESVIYEKQPLVA